MTALLIKDITIADSGPNGGKTADILIENGVVREIGTINDPKADVIQGKGCCISRGWVDSLAYCGEPGEEWKEDLNSLANSAHAGGFTHVAAFCGSHPFPDKASAISSIVKKSAGLNAVILPYGTASKNREGKEIAELYDMKTAGAVAFTDGECLAMSESLKVRVMEYSANCGVPFVDFAAGKDFYSGGVMNDGVMSNSLGMRGIPAIAEINAVSSALRIADWLKTPLRIATISAAESVDLIREAKSRGMDITVSVAVMNLLFTDENLSEFNENFKVLPPLRTDRDRLALIDGILDGTIDAVCSNHQPQDSESKDVEFEYAAFGAASIQVVYPMLIEALGNKLSNELIAAVLYSGPMKLLNLNIEKIVKDSSANFTIFDPSKNWKLNAETNKSKSKNSPLFGKELKGSVVGTVLNGEWFPATLD